MLGVATALFGDRRGISAVASGSTDVSHSVAIARPFDYLIGFSLSVFGACFRIFSIALGVFLFIVGLAR